MYYRVSLRSRKTLQIYRTTDLKLAYTLCGTSFKLCICYDRYFIYLSGETSLHLCE